MVPPKYGLDGIRITFIFFLTYLHSLTKAGWMFGAHVDDTDSYALVGCKAAPDYEFADFEMLGRKQLLG